MSEHRWEKYSLTLSRDFPLKNGRVQILTGPDPSHMTPNPVEILVSEKCTICGVDRCFSKVDCDEYVCERVLNE